MCFWWLKWMCTVFVLVWGEMMRTVPSICCNICKGKIDNFTDLKSNASLRGQPRSICFHESYARQGLILGFAHSVLQETECWHSTARKAIRHYLHMIKAEYSLYIHAKISSRLSDFNSKKNYFCKYRPLQENCTREQYFMSTFTPDFALPYFSVQ